MFDCAKLLFLHALTSLHPGSGSEIGLVDLPVQREKHTGYPKVEASSLKGAIRSVIEAKVRDNNKIEKIFGLAGDKDKSSDTHAGALSFSDARVLLFPVRSLKGVFAWVTCPFAVNRFNHEVKAYSSIMEGNLPELPQVEPNTVSSRALVIAGGNRPISVVLDEYTFEVQEKEGTRRFAETLGNLVFPGLGSGFTDRVVVLSDDAFTDFVSLCTEVNARIRIESTKGTVEDGGLWYEELVPPETVFYSFCFTGKERTATENALTGKEVMDFLTDSRNLPEVFQIGGDSTVGRGFVRRIWV